MNWMLRPTGLWEIFNYNNSSNFFVLSTIRWQEINVWCGRNQLTTRFCEVSAWTGGRVSGSWNKDLPCWSSSRSIYLRPHSVNGGILFFNRRFFLFSFLSFAAVCSRSFDWSATFIAQKVRYRYDFRNFVQNLETTLIKILGPKNPNFGWCTALEWTKISPI